MFTVNVVPDIGFSQTDVSIITERLKDRVGKSVVVNVVSLSEIPRSANGKFKAVISKVKNK